MAVAANDVTVMVCGGSGNGGDDDGDAKLSKTPPFLFTTYFFANYSGVFFLFLFLSAYT